MSALESALKRSRNELEAAQHLVAGGFARQATSRAYYAAFHSAEAALLSLGETRSKHSGVIAAFGQLVVRGGGFDPEVGKILRSLFERRGEADYAGVTMSVAEAESAITDAARFVNAVDAWLKERSG